MVKLNGQTRPSFVKHVEQQSSVYRGCVDREVSSALPMHSESQPHMTFSALHLLTYREAELKVGFTRSERVFSETGSHVT